MGLIINGTEYVSGELSGGSRNIGDIFYTTRLDNELNGAVECNGGQYNIDDYSGIGSIGELLQSKKLPYISINEFDSRISESGSCGYFGYGTQTSIPLYAWNNMISSGNYVYTKSEEPVENDPVYQLSDNIISQIGTVVSNETNGLRINFGSMVVAQNSRSVDNDTSYTETTETEYFKVPKLNKIYIQADSSNVGQHLSAGLPNIDGNCSIWTGTSNNGNGALYVTSKSTQGLGNNAYRVFGSLDFDASRCSSIYGNSDTVTPETICLRPMIQLFNGSTDTALATCNAVIADVGTLKSEVNSLSYDYIIESQAPSESNGYTWYRLYKSGWVEQGGYVSYTGSWIASHNDSVVLPIEFANTDYRIMIGRTQPADGDVLTSYDINKTTTGFSISSYAVNQSTAVASNWFAVGMSAQGV